MKIFIGVSLLAISATVGIRFFASEKREISPSPLSIISSEKDSALPKTLNTTSVNIDDTTEAPAMVEKFINYSEERKKLSLEYMEQRHGIKQKEPVIHPKIIVLHYTGDGNIKSIFNYFNNIYIEKERSFNQKQSPLNVSSHYVIERDGTIYHLVPDTLFCRHAIGLNYCAIGVENIGSEKSPLTEKQVVANAKLVRYLTKKYKLEYLIGHSEYGKFRNSSLWKETNPKYFTSKGDPGDDFMKKVRGLLKDLELKYGPEK